MNKLRTTLIWVLVTALVSLSLTGCSKKEDTPAEVPSTTAVQPEETPVEETPAADHPAGDHPAGDHPQ